MAAVLLLYLMAGLALGSTVAICASWLIDLLIARRINRRKGVN